MLIFTSLYANIYLLLEQNLMALQPGGGGMFFFGRVFKATSAGIKAENIVKKTAAAWVFNLCSDECIQCWRVRRS